MMNSNSKFGRRKLWVLLLALIATPTMYSASVIYGGEMFEAQHHSWAPENEMAYVLYMPYLPMTGIVDAENITLKVEAYSYMEFASKVFVASRGDVVDSSSANGQKSYFYYSELNTVDCDIAFSDYDLTIARGKNVFLGYENTITGGSSVYGWFELSFTEDGSLELTRGLYDSAGAAVIVGATPEPSGGMLVLFGLCVLLLRREWNLSLPRDFAQ